MFGVHTKVPTISSGADTVLYLYWDSTHTVGDNPMVGNTGEAPAQNVWDSGFWGVWHLSGVSDVDTILESTDASRDFPTTIYINDDGDFTDSKPGRGFAFPGSPVRLQINCDITDFPVTLELAGEVTDQTTLSGPILSIGNSGSSDRNVTVDMNQTEARVAQDSNVLGYEQARTVNRNYIVGDFVHVVGVLENSTSRFVVGNGIEVVTNSDPLSFPGGVDKLMLGARVNSSPSYKKGIASEARVSIVARSVAWIKATWYTLDGDLLTGGAPIEIQTFEQPFSWDLQPGDSYFNVDPNLRVPGIGDIFQNVWTGTGGGNRWFDVLCDNNHSTSWDTLNEFVQGTAWDILNKTELSIAWDILNALANQIAWSIVTSMDQDFSWSVFAERTYYIQQFFVKAICFNFGIKEPVLFNKQIVKPINFTFKTDSLISTTVNLMGSVDIARTFCIKSPTQYTFGIKNPLVFTINVDTVQQGSTPVKQLH
jgi:hypothetical protein